jgi:hypothetical protein
VPTATAAVTATTGARRIPFTDDFSDPASGFAARQVSDGSIGYVNGRLELGVPAGVELYSPYRDLDEPDVVVSVQGSVTSGPPLTEMGIICRWQGEADFIAGVLRGDGMVSLWRKSAGEVERWVDWTPLADGSLDLSATHSLQLTCQSDGIRFTVDGVEAATAQDPSPSTGTIALLAGLLEEGQATVAFDDMVVSRP